VGTHHCNGTAYLHVLLNHTKPYRQLQTDNWDIKRSERLILAIDGGGMKTRAVLAQSEGRILEQATGVFSNLTSDFDGSLQKSKLSSLLSTKPRECLFEPK
jgi:hypothetical protein